MVQQKQIIPENRYNEQRAYQNPPVNPQAASKTTNKIEE